MSQITVRLPDELNSALEAAASRLQRKRGEVVRIALRRFLGLDGDGRASARVCDLLGSVESGVPDLAQEHRKYVLEALTGDA